MAGNFRRAVEKASRAWNSHGGVFCGRHVGVMLCKAAFRNEMVGMGIRNTRNFCHQRIWDEGPMWTVTLGIVDDSSIDISDVKTPG